MKEIEDDMRPTLVEAVSWLARWLRNDKQRAQPERLLFMAESSATLAMVQTVTESDPAASAAQAQAWQALIYLGMAGLSSVAPDDPLIDDSSIPPQGWAMHANRRIRDLRDTLGAANNTSVIVGEQS